MITLTVIVLAMWIVSGKTLALICVSYSGYTQLTDTNLAMSAIYQSIKSRSPGYGLSRRSLKVITPIYRTYIAASWALLALIAVHCSLWLTAIAT